MTDSGENKNAASHGAMRMLVLGGARSGKSGFAHGLARSRWKKPLYVATAEALDPEMVARIRRHRAERARCWRCAEEPLEIARLIEDGRSGADGMLVECVTLWLSNVLLKEGRGAVRRRSAVLLRALRRARCDVILVANEVGMGLVPENKLGRIFRDLAGRLNQELAAVADIVVLVVAGQPLVIKGMDEYRVISANNCRR